MDIFDVFQLLGGLALFLYGISIMGSGLEKTAGSRLESILQKLTGSPLRSVALGTAITALIQSSSATTVIIVGLVNSGILKLSQAIGVIMGANIGTTVTGQIVRLTEVSGTGLIYTFFKPSSFAPILAFIGMVLFVFFKNNTKRNIGQIMLGFGLLFIGMGIMTDSVEALESSPLFEQLFTSLQNPILGVLAGTLVTVLVQSSSASVGILQALSVTGVITWGSAIPIILGQNIGTCSTPLIASIGASKAAKRSACVHLYFNIIGSLLFLCLVYLLKAIFDFTWWFDSINMTNIANFHTLFNVSVTLAFLPFTKLLAKLAEMTIKDTEADLKKQINMPILDKRLLATPSVALNQAHIALGTMADYSKQNFETAVKLFDKYDEEEVNLAEQREKVIDKLEVNVGDYLIEVTDREVHDEESRKITDYINFIIEFERIGDYSIDLINRVSEINDKQITLSETASKELSIINSAVEESITLSNESFSENDAKKAYLVRALEEVIDEMFTSLRNAHILRLQNGSCYITNGVIFLEIITTLERISDHCSNVASRVINSVASQENLDTNIIHNDVSEDMQAEYSENLKLYNEKYLDTLTKIVKKNENATSEM